MFLFPHLRSELLSKVSNQYSVHLVRLLLSGILAHFNHFIALSPLVYLTCIILTEFWDWVVFLENTLKRSGLGNWRKLSGLELSKLGFRLNIFDFLNHSCICFKGLPHFWATKREINLDLRYLDSFAYFAWVFIHLGLKTLQRHLDSFNYSIGVIFLSPLLGF